MQRGDRQYCPFSRRSLLYLNFRCALASMTSTCTCRPSWLESRHRYPTGQRPAAGTARGVHLDVHSCAVPLPRVGRCLALQASTPVTQARALPAERAPLCHKIAGVRFLQHTLGVETSQVARYNHDSLYESSVSISTHCWCIMTGVSVYAAQLCARIHSSRGSNP